MDPVAQEANTPSLVSACARNAGRFYEHVKVMSTADEKDLDLAESTDIKFKLPDRIQEGTESTTSGESSWRWKS